MKITSESTHVLKALLDIQKVVTRMPRTAAAGSDSGTDYTYVRYEDVLAAVKQQATQVGCLVVFSVLSTETVAHHEMGTPAAEYLVRTRLQASLVHAESGQSITVESVGEGIDSADKAAVKSITAASKYGLYNLVGIASSDDPEADARYSPSVRAEGAASSAELRQRNAIGRCLLVAADHLRSWSSAIQILRDVAHVEHYMQTPSSALTATLEAFAHRGYTPDRLDADPSIRDRALRLRDEAAQPAGLSAPTGSTGSTGSPAASTSKAGSGTAAARQSSPRGGRSATLGANAPA